MPQFPTYNLPQVERQALPTVRFDPSAPAAAFGIGLGQQIQDTGELLAWNASRMQAQDDENAAFDAFYRASEAMDLYLNGANGQPGLYSRQGKAALGSTREATMIFGEIERQGSGTLRTENAKARYQRLMLQHTTTQRHNVSVFERQQRSVASEEAVGSAKANALRRVAQSPDPGTIFDAKFSVVGAYRANGRSDLEIAEVFTEIDELAANNQIRTVIREDPLNAAHLLVDSEAYAHMSMAWRESWTNVALTEFNEVTRAQHAEEERERKVSDQRQAKLEEETAKELDTMLAKGTLNTGIVMQNRGNLAKSDYRFYLEKLSGAIGDVKTNPAVFDDLYTRAMAGEDVTDEVRAAHTSLQLTNGDYKTLLKRIEEGPSMPHHIKYWERDLAGRMGDDTTLVSFGARQRKYDVMAAYHAWWKANPDATEEEAEAKARNLVRSHSIVDLQKQLVSVTLPKHLVGTRMNPDLTATKAAIEQAFVSGEDSQAEYDEEGVRLARLYELLERKRQLEEDRKAAK